MKAQSIVNAVVVAVLLLPFQATAQPTSVAVLHASRLERGQLRIDVLVDSATGGGLPLEVAEITFPSGGAAAPHRHGATEVLYVIQGELDHIVNGTVTRLGPGMVGIVRAGDTVTHRVIPGAIARVLAIWTPVGEVGRLVRGFGAGIRAPIRSLADDLSSLRRLRESWSDAYGAGQLEPLRDMYTASAVRMPYDAPAQVGRDSVLDAYVHAFAARSHTPRIVLTPSQVELRGDLAMERGAYDEILTPRGQGRTIREVGKYVSLLRRGVDGQWRYEWSMFNRDGAAH